MVIDPDGYSWQVDVDVRLKDIEVDPTNSKPGRAAVRWHTSVGALVRNMTPERANPVSLGYQYYVYLGLPLDTVFCEGDSKPGVRMTDGDMCYRQFATFVDQVYAEHGFFNVATPPVLDANTTDIMNVAVISGLDETRQFPSERQAEYEDAWEVDLPENVADQWKEELQKVKTPKLILTLEGPHVQDDVAKPCEGGGAQETGISVPGPDKYHGVAPACDVLNRILNG